MSETPDWAKGAVSTLNPTAKAQAKPTVDRIAAARARGMARSKDSNADSNYGFNHPASYWQDFAGPETSAWDAEVLVCLAGILETPILNRSKFVWQAEHYDARAGQFNLSDTPAVSIQELKDAVDNRITELGLSKVAIWEWYADVREPIGREWWREDLETRIQKFKR
jgi:hypothetical protein